MFMMGAHEEGQALSSELEEISDRIMVRLCASLIVLEREGRSVPLSVSLSISVCACLSVCVSIHVRVGMHAPWMLVTALQYF